MNSTMRSSFKAADVMNELAKALDSELQKLSDLGTPDAIAEFLRQQGVTGLRGDSRFCPLANYLRAKFSGQLVFVGPRYVGLSGTLAGADMMRNLTNFIIGFDGGSWSFLDEQWTKERSNPGGTATEDRGAEPPQGKE